MATAERRPVEGPVFCGDMPSKAGAVCAYAVLRRVFEQDAYADLALRSEARELDARDRALAMRLAYGAVQRQGTLDYLIERLTERPVKRLDAPRARGAAAGAVRAAVSRRRPRPRGGGGRCRAGEVERAARRPGSRPAAEVTAWSTRCCVAPHARARRCWRCSTTARPRRAALKHSHPEWVARLWWEQLGAEDARALLAFDNEPAELALRVNTLVAEPAGVAEQLRTSPRPVGVHGDPRIPEALVLEGPWDVHGSPQWRAGAVLAQSRGAMLAAAGAGAPAGRAGARPVRRTWRQEHAPRGVDGRRGEVVAVERNRRRAAELQRTIERLRTRRVRAGGARRRGAAAARRAAVRPRAGGPAVLGTGNAAGARGPALAGPGQGRGAAARRRRRRSSQPAPQRSVRAVCWSTLRARSPQTENESQISPSWNPIPASPWMTSVLTLPHRDHTAGFFIARLCRAVRLSDGRASATRRAPPGPRPAVPELLRAVAAPHESAGALPLRLLPAPLRAGLGVPQLRRALDDRANVLDRDPQVQ